MLKAATIPKTAASMKSLSLSKKNFIIWVLRRISHNSRKLTSLGSKRNGVFQAASPQVIPVKSVIEQKTKATSEEARITGPTDILFFISSQAEDRNISRIEKYEAMAHET